MHEKESKGHLDWSHIQLHFLLPPKCSSHPPASLIACITYITLCLTLALASGNWLSFGLRQDSQTDSFSQQSKKKKTKRQRVSQRAWHLHVSLNLNVLSAERTWSACSNKRTSQSLVPRNVIVKGQRRRRRGKRRRRSSANMVHGVSSVKSYVKHRARDAESKLQCMFMLFCF